MTRKIIWGLTGGLVIIGLAGIIISQRALQPTMAETAAAVVEPTAAPTAHPFEPIATYRNEEFGFTLQYPKTVPCRDDRAGEICEIDMTPRDVSSIGVRESVVYSLHVNELSFYITIEKKMADFTTLFDLVQDRNQHLNDEISDPPIIIKDVRQFTWQGYPAVASNEQYKGRLECSLHVEREAYLYRLSYPYPCRLLTDADVSDLSENDANEQKKMSVVKMMLESFVFDKGGQ